MFFKVLLWNVRPGSFSENGFTTTNKASQPFPFSSKHSKAANKKCSRNVPKSTFNKKTKKVQGQTMFQVWWMVTLLKHLKTFSSSCADGLNWEHSRIPIDDCSWMGGRQCYLQVKECLRQLLALWKCFSELAIILISLPTQRWWWRFSTNVEEWCYDMKAENSCGFRIIWCDDDCGFF